MTRNEVKKLIYKEKPVANLIKIQNGIAFYSAEIEAQDIDLIHFHIPVSDMGEASFTYEMEAKLLLRWIAK